MSELDVSSLVLVGCPRSVHVFFVFFLKKENPPFSPQFCGIQLLSHRYNSRTGSGETKVESHASSDTQPNQPHCFLTQRASNPEASRNNVSEDTPCTRQPWLARTAPGPPQDSLVRDETRTSLPTKPSPNPDDARPIVHCPTDLPDDKAWARTLGL